MKRRVALFAAATACLSCSHSLVDARVTAPLLQRSFAGRSLQGSLHRTRPSAQRAAASTALSLRGGADEDDKEEKKNVGNALTGAINNITPTTRTYLLGCLALAALTLAGVPEELFLFEFQRTFFQGQVWRPFTSACFLGKVDMSMMSQIYFLVNFGQEMERQDGPVQHAMFLLTQVVLLMGLATLTGYPSFARSLITASIYCCSRREPMRPMEVQFGVRVEYWLLPYVNMVIDCLQAQSASGAVPHVLGILTGHVYHFFSVVWPKMGGKRYLAAPGLLEAAVNGKSAPSPKKKQAAKPAAKKASPVKEDKKTAKPIKKSKAGTKKAPKKAKK